MIGPVFKGLGLEFGILGGSWKKGNCCALDWEIFLSLKEQDFDILAFMLRTTDDTYQLTRVENKESLIQSL